MSDEIKNITRAVRQQGWETALAHYPRGLYVLRGIKESKHVLRVGAGGVRNGKTGLYDRFKKHMRENQPNSTIETHKHMPFENIHGVWEVHWNIPDLRSAEKLLHSAALARFPNRIGSAKDSLYLIDDDILKVNDLVKTSNATFNALDKMLCSA